MIDQNTLEQLAGLARLTLTDAEKKDYTGQLNYILEQVNIIKQVDTSQVEPTNYVLQIQNCFRPDQVGKHLKPEQSLANAADTQDNYFKVPRII